MKTPSVVGWSSGQLVATSRGLVSGSRWHRAAAPKPLPLAVYDSQNGRGRARTCATEEGGTNGRVLALASTVCRWEGSVVCAGQAANRPFSSDAAESSKNNKLQFQEFLSNSKAGTRTGLEASRVRARDAMNHAKHKRMKFQERAKEGRLGEYLLNFIAEMKRYQQCAKQLYYNFKEYRVLKKRAEASSPGREALTPEELRSMARTKLDLMMAVPFVLFWQIPFVGGLIIPLTLVVPRILPPIFRSAHQQEVIDHIDQQRQFDSYPAVIHSLLQQVRAQCPKDGRVHPLATHTKAAQLSDALEFAIHDRLPVSDASILSALPLFQRPPAPSSQGESGRELDDSMLVGLFGDTPEGRAEFNRATLRASIHTLAPHIPTLALVAVPRSLLEHVLRRLTSRVLQGDLTIRCSGGVSELSDEAVELACAERGVPLGVVWRGDNTEQLRRLLAEWVALTTPSHQPNQQLPMTLVAVLPSLKYHHLAQAPEICDEEK